MCGLMDSPGDLLIGRRTSLIMLGMRTVLNWMYGSVNGMTYNVTQKGTYYSPAPTLQNHARMDGYLSMKDATTSLEIKRI